MTAGRGRVAGMRIPERRTQPSYEKVQAYREDYRARHHAQYGKQLFGDHVLRREERHESERKDAERVSDSYSQSQKCRVAGRASGADKVRAYDGLSVSGRERVQGPKHRGYQ